VAAACIDAGGVVVILLAEGDLVLAALVVDPNAWILRAAATGGLAGAVQAFETGAADVLLVTRCASRVPAADFANADVVRAAAIARIVAPSAGPGAALWRSIGSAPRHILTQPVATLVV
jgi:hypothetical protein